MGWIEQWGSGFERMTRACREADLPEPEWEERAGAFWLTFRKDVLTEEYLRGLGLNERQVRAVLHLKAGGNLTNQEYQRLNAVSKASATRDLTDLASRGLVNPIGTGRRTLQYVLGEPKMSQK